MRYVEVEHVPRSTALDDESNGDMVVRENNQSINHTEVHNNINTVTSSVLPTIRQPTGYCDPESDFPCFCPRRRFADPPDQLPMPATHSNVPALEGWIKEYFKESAFNQCRRQEWPVKTGKPMRIHTKPDAIPYCCRKPTVVPLNFQAQVKADIEADVMKGILERVPVGEPDCWCSRMVMQEKKNGKARRSVDLSYLSKRGLAESHNTPSAAIFAKRILGNKFKST